MDHISKYLTPEIKLSSYDDKFFKSEIVFDQHMLIWFISGETKIVQAESTYSFKTGDIFLIPRNKPATIINYPKDGLPHKTVVMLLTTKILRDFYSKIDVTTKVTPVPSIRSYNRHPLLESCLASLIPYFDVQGPFPENLALLKITEAISVLRTIDPTIDGVLSNFEDPHKVELVNFMEKNYVFNMPLEKFGYLTGRSLTTFKRDLRKHSTHHHRNGLCRNGWSSHTMSSRKKSGNPWRSATRSDLKICPTSPMHSKNTLVTPRPALDS